jgi:hypothetical protein
MLVDHSNVRGLIMKESEIAIFKILLDARCALLSVNYYSRFYTKTRTQSAEFVFYAGQRVVIFKF